MKAAFMAVGAALLALGAALIAFGPTCASLVIAETPIGPNTGALTWGLLLSVLGVMLSPLGAGVLAYGIGAKDQVEMA